MAKTELKYKTFNQLLDEVSSDFTTYSLENMIAPEQLIKVANRVNYELGLRIHKTKEVMLDISHNKARLPSDFYVLNYAQLCYKYTVNSTQLSGRHTEDILTSDIEYSNCCETCKAPNSDCSCIATNTTVCPAPTCVSLCDDYTVVEVVKHETRVYNYTEPLYLKPGKGISKYSPNTRFKCGRNGEIKNGFIYTDICEGKVYISYEGAMEDDEGNLLVLDHPLINEFYETAVKHRILENLYMNGESVEQKLGYMKENLRVARINALSIVNTPDFSELKAVFDMNRKAQYQKYYYMFAS